MSKNGFGKFVVGASIGAAVTALFTTKKGKEYQAKIVDLCNEMLDKAKNIDAEDVKNAVECKVNEIKLELADLDAEKVKEIAIRKAKDIEAKASDLVDYAVEKGTPVVEEMAKNLKKEAIKATKVVLKKLEESSKEEN